MLSLLLRTGASQVPSHMPEVKPWRRQGDLTSDNNCVHLIFRPMPDHRVLHTACTGAQPTALLRAEEEWWTSCGLPWLHDCIAISCTSPQPSQSQVYACSWAIVQRNERIWMVLLLTASATCNLKADNFAKRKYQSISQQARHASLVVQLTAHIKVGPTQTCVSWLDMILPFLRCLLS